MDRFFKKKRRKICQQQMAVIILFEFYIKIDFKLSKKNSLTISPNSHDIPARVRAST